MGYLSKVTGGRIDVGNAIGSITGANASEDIAEATQSQVQAGREAIDALRGDLAPYREFGEGFLPQMQEQLSPEGQANFLQNNPLFNSLADDVQARLFANRAAAGKLGSGGTLSALNNALIPLGSNLYQQNLSNLFAGANIGQNSAAQAGAGTANILQGIGNAQAAGAIGQANAQQGGISNLIGLGFLGKGLGLFGGGGT